MEKVSPAELKSLIVDSFSINDDCSYLEGIQPMLVRVGSKAMYIYAKNISSAYFADRPNITRSQLGWKEEFELLKEKDAYFIFIGYDKANDVMVCWNPDLIKKRLNHAKTVSFYSDIEIQRKVEVGNPIRIQQGNGYYPIVFKRADLPSILTNIETLFPNLVNASKPVVHKIPKQPNIEVELSEKERIDLKNLVLAGHKLEALNYLGENYGSIYPNLTMKDWVELLKKL